MYTTSIKYTYNIDNNYHTNDNTYCLLFLINMLRYSQAFYFIHKHDIVFEKFKGVSV